MISAGGEWKKNTSMIILIKTKQIGNMRFVILFLLVVPFHPLLLHAQEKPNIIFILADDWGWTDWNMNGDANGSTFYETPNIDRLAQGGMYFSQAYAQPLCSPSRAALMTGKYPGSRLHMHQAITGASVAEPNLPVVGSPGQKTCFPGSRDHLPLEEITIAEELQKAGYNTFQFGKWHLGNSNYDPVKQGFDKQFAVGGAGPGRGGYFAPYNGLSDISQGPDGEYIADRLTHEVCQTLENEKNEPFFIYMAHYNVHSPYQGKEEVVAKYDAKSKTDPANKHLHPTMGAMVQALDESVGKIVDKLDELGLSENTIVVLMGDNGGVHWANDKNPKYKDIPVTSNAPLRAGKACFYEGGVRVPLIIRYPKMVRPGSTEATPVHLIDFYPTLLQLAQIKQSPEKDVLDGQSLIPLLWGKGTFPERAIFCHFPRAKQIGADVGGSFVRMGDYKLCRLYGQNDDGSDRYELYDIANDISEQNDLATRLPAVRDSLAAMLDKWLKETKALVPHVNPDWDKSIRVEDENVEVGE